jgi:DNA-binding protein HU-beta
LKPCVNELKISIQKPVIWFCYAGNRVIFARQNYEQLSTLKTDYNMTKAEIVTNIADKTGIDRTEVQVAVESFMKEVKNSLESGENVYLRGFGSFIIKTRAEKTGRNISRNTTLVIPAHNIPSFKPAKTFVEAVKDKVKVNVEA